VSVVAVDSRRADQEQATTDLPSVAVVIPNWNGVEHLPDCLASIAALDYPVDRYEVIVVDNGSSDSSRELLAADHGSARLIPLDENLGFAEACNRGAQATDAECVAFVNNDMRVDPSWLMELISLYEPDAGYVCVAGVILDWDGGHVDFVDGSVNFHGRAHQPHFGKPVADALIEDGRDLLFACGGSMLVGREIFLELGGFDPDYFAFYEDVDLGWRLWVTGHRVRLAGKARSFHRHHGTASSIAIHQRQLMHERNALLTLLKNVSDENLGAVLSAALFLLVERSVIRSGSDRRAFDVGVPAEETETVPRVALAGLHAVSDTLADLTRVLERRREIQRRRERSDEEIFALFRHPFAPAVRNDGYLEASLELRAALGLDRLFTRQRPTQLLVVGTGDSKRLHQIARDAAVFAPVVYAAPSVASVPDVVAVSVDGDDQLEELIAESDLVLTSGMSVHAGTLAARTLGVLVVDLDGGDGEPHPGLLKRGDVFLCSSPESRDVWLETLDRRGRKTGSERGSPLVVVVPNENGPERSGVLRSIIEEPWIWTEGRLRSGQPALPQDALVLLRHWRERYQAASSPAGVARAMWHRLPRVVRKPIRRAFKRSASSGGDA
jgi:GT2 family glycosyltransferase